jgi:hypothetical protein
MHVNGNMTTSTRAVKVIWACAPETANQASKALTAKLARSARRVDCILITTMLAMCLLLVIMCSA